MVAGYADTKPLVSNSSEQNRAHNRRVDIVIMKSEAKREIELAIRSEVRRVTVNGVSDTPSDSATIDRSSGARDTGQELTAPTTDAGEINSDGRQGDTIAGP